MQTTKSKIIFPSWDKTFGTAYCLGISAKEKLKKEKKSKLKKEKSLLNIFLFLEQKGV